MTFKRWMYRGGRPHTLARVLNGGWARIHSTGILPKNYVTLDVLGRRSGKTVSLPLAMAVVDGRRYLVSMLGVNANWVLNVKAAGGRATLRHGGAEKVILTEVDAGQRAPILKEYLRIAPGARPHIPVDKDAPLSEFEPIAVDYPVFRVEPAETSQPAAGR
ncbi:MAG: nitroreductase family deazaflavin-dependent oxidoreductase [Anaerolineae bacterium]|nr:nitroreductase family deazaflavin-dependent oxidoreductase [Anaerolineae bacterium]MCB0247625.1 nitroreductase family deazaflavin-dependent oxidoreductase [Anaerolineae bacterium]MCO5244500.1 nitroreductase/quinone reductase family protein [Anaerolineae bacterium]